MAAYFAVLSTQLGFLGHDAGHRQIFRSARGNYRLGVVLANLGVPLLTTVHGFSSPRILPAYRAARSSFVSISDADRSPDLDYIATVYGVDVDGLPFTPSGGPGLVSFG